MRGGRVHGRIGNDSGQLKVGFHTYGEVKMDDLKIEVIP